MLLPAHLFGMHPQAGLQIGQLRLSASTDSQVIPQCPSIPLFKWVRFLAASTPEDFKFQNLEMSRKLYIYILFPKVFERKLGNTAVCNMLCNHRVCQDALGFGEAVLQCTSGRTSLYIYICWLYGCRMLTYNM